MTGPADYEGLAALFGHDGHPLGWAGLPGPAEIGKFADLMYFDISVLLADFAFVPEKSLNDLAVTARGRVRDAINGDRVPVPLEGNPTEPCDQWFPARLLDSGFEAGA
jgi:hypothetical protein